MIKLTILYRTPADVEAFEAFYNANLALLEHIPGVVRREASVILGAPGGESPYYRGMALYFEDFESFDRGMRSPAGEAAGRHLMSFAAELAELFYAEVFEEAGGHTPQVEPGRSGAGDMASAAEAANPKPGDETAADSAPPDVPAGEAEGKP